MRIAQVAPLYERVPPKWYGGTERIVSYLTEELVQAGHQVSLFASGDSITSAKLIAPCPQALRLDPQRVDKLAPHFLELEEVFERMDEFDLIHFHIDYLHFPTSRRAQAKTLTTLHGRLDIPELKPLYRKFSEMPLVSISNAQREPMPWANWIKTIHHGIPRDLYRLMKEPGKYLAFIGRASPEKGLDDAIQIAQRVEMPLKIAAKVEDVDRSYFECMIRPLLDHPLVEFIGEIGDAEKGELLGGAYALLFPINWPEPFGLVMIEAFACGTPVIAFRRGSASEVMQDGVSGFIVNDVNEATQAIPRVMNLSREACREYFEQRFTSFHMMENYFSVYEGIC